jgi:hypothetical protein
MLALAELEQKLRRYRIVIVEAPFGSGKSKQLPLFLERLNPSSLNQPKILTCLQPEQMITVAKELKRGLIPNYLMIDDIEVNPWQLEILLAVWLSLSSNKPKLRLLLCGSSWVTDSLAERKDVGLHLIRPPVYPARLIYASDGQAPISTLIPQLGRNFCFFEDSIPSGVIATCDSIVIRNLRDSATLYRILEKLGFQKPVDVYLTLTVDEVANLPNEVTRDRTLAQKVELLRKARELSIPLVSLQTDCRNLERDYNQFQVWDSRWLGKLDWSAIHLRALEILLSEPVSSTLILCLCLLQSRGIIFNMRGLRDLEALDLINQQFPDLKSETLNQFWWRLARKIEIQFPGEVTEAEALPWTLLSSFFFQPIYQALHNRNIILATIETEASEIETVAVARLSQLARKLLEWSPEAFLGYTEEQRGYRNSAETLFYFEEPLVSRMPISLVLFANTEQRVNRALEI